MHSDRGGERRLASRRTPAADEPLSQVRLRAGRELVVVNVSDAGLLAEGTMRLLPGTHVDVHLVTREGRRLIRSRVVRAFVCHVSSECIRYRGALTFERPVDTASIGYAVPDAFSRRTAAQGNPYPDPAQISVDVAAGSTSA